MAQQPSWPDLVRCWNSPLARRWARGLLTSVEDCGADAARPVVLKVIDALQRLDDVVAAAVVLCVLDDVLLLRRVVHAPEGLLDVDRAHHVPRPTPRG